MTCVLFAVYVRGGYVVTVACRNADEARFIMHVAYEVCLSEVEVRCV